MIESSSNPQIKRIQKLMKNAGYRRKEGCFVVEGWKMVEEAFSMKLIEHLYVAEDQIEHLADWQGMDQVPMDTMAASLFRQLSDTVTPQGVLAIVKMPVYQREDLVSQNEASFLCLENIQDPGNLGTMMRTAEGAGMTAVVLSRGCVDLFNPKVVRSTMGGMFRVPFYFCDDMTTEVERLKMERFSIYAAHLQGTKDFTQVPYQGNVGILIGNEANGLSDAVSDLADYKVKIPMEGKLESLNAAVSAALFMYEVHRNR
ncbi:MAG: RNA methyltransferase [Eubacterium sp.]|nr:RNA methyltransferase [Eubacterium sp.]